MTATTTEHEHEYEWHEVQLPVAQMTHDITVNPRDPSPTWVRQHLPNFSPVLLGQFVLSHRLAVPADGDQPGRPEMWVILDGGNRAELVRLAAHENQPQSCKVFEGLTISQEATIALGYNDRRNWLTVRKFQAELAQGDPIALALQAIAVKHGWEITTDTGAGKIRGIKDLMTVLDTAVRMEIKAADAVRGTEQYRAATESGQRDGLRALEEAFDVYTSAFPSRPSGYAPLIIRGIALLLLRDGSKVQLDRLTTRVRDLSGGQASIVPDGRAMGKTMRLNTPEGIAMLITKFYNQGLAGNAKNRLEEGWKKLA